jgi:hypothetical protein
VPEAVAEALHVAALDGRTPRQLVLAGGRGGKTLSMDEAASIAANEPSWLTVPIEIRPMRPFTPQLLERLSRPGMSTFRRPRENGVEVTVTTIKAQQRPSGGCSIRDGSTFSLTPRVAAGGVTRAHPD